MGAGGSSGTVRQVPPQNGALAESTVVCVQPKGGSSGTEISEPEPESFGQEMRPQVIAWGDTAKDQQDASPKTVSADKTGKESSPSATGGHRPVESRDKTEQASTRNSTPAKAITESGAPGGMHLQGFGSAQNSDIRGALRPGQAVRICGLENATYLNGKQGVLRCWDSDLGRWVVRLGNGEDKGIRTVNLAPVHGPGKLGVNSKSIATDSMSEQANKELEGLLLQTNWSAIYQLFYQRFGITVLERLERGYAVKAAVEMSLSIVAKCFALLRSDPGGRLHCTPLHIAALQSSTEAAEVIVRDLPKLVEQTHRPSHSALCPLHIAILCGSQAIVELLLEGQADPNVRTLHDVCPMHLAATTSKELCQVLLSYSAEPLRRDVMGSTVVHYAASFKQQAVVEFLLGNAASPARLASEGDQKRVTPLHISCALYTGEEDLLTPMILLASGAKPWQADVSGASARDVVPWSPTSALSQFFESNGDRAQAAASQWIEQRKATSDSKDAESESSSDEGDGEGSNTSKSRIQKDDDDLGASAAAGSPRESPAKKKAEANEASTTRAGMGLSEQATASSATPAGTSLAAAEAAANEAKAEVERLKAEHAAEVERLKQELANSAEKCARLEQSSTNQQRNFEALQKLGEETQSQHKSQLDDIQRRQAQERADWEAQLRSQLNVAREEARAEALKEAQLENAAQMENLKRSFNTQREELQAQLREAEAARDAAEEKADGVGDMKGMNFGATLNGFGTTLAKITDQARSQEEQEEFKEQIRELTEELERLEKLHADEQAQRSSEIKTLQDQLHKAQEEAAQKRASYVEAQSELQRLSDESKREIAGLQGLAAANQEQVRSLQEEATQLRARQNEAQDRCQQLAQEKQNAESKLSAERIAFETKIQDLQLQHAQAFGQERSEAEAARLRAEAAVAQAEQMQPLITRLNVQIETLEQQFAEEQRLRKKYHNQIQDMKGAIRVFCRFRPLVKRELEAGDTISTKKLDAFTVQVARPERESHGRGRRHEDDSKPFNFDSVFDSDSTQDEVFADCRELVQSAVDGFNVTIFAYGQTGAGKTFTMYGNQEHPGLAPRSIDALFNVIQREERHGKTFKVKAYMIEVYKQDILDLLVEHRPQQRGDKGHAPHLEVKRDMARGMMYVEGVTEREVFSPDELLALLAEGEKRRHVTATRMNSASSRSHLLLSIIIECTLKESEQVVYGKITLCDLAGSERPKKSEVSGDALKEAIEINKSLSALGDVIEALTKGAKSVPYRNHKLTMLMQDSLGGTAKTLMFVNCSPAASNNEETVMSLKWASRARQITNDVKRHADSKEVARLKQVIAMMSQAADAQEAPDGAGSAEDAAMPAGGRGVENVC